MIRVPLQAVPNQTLAISLARQAVQIAVRQNGEAMYFDLRFNGAPVTLTRICRDRARLLTGAHYHGFAGDFAFVDTQGREDPNYTGLGARWQLYYLGADE